jgi:hypothetical protein
VSHPNSPNGCWSRHGYRVERYAAQPGWPVKLRRIYAPDGALVLDGQGYDEEVGYCRVHGLMDQEATHDQGL